MEIAASGTPTRRFWQIVARASVAGLTLAFLTHAGPAFAQQQLRSLGGVVTDTGHEPLTGAVVEVVNVNSKTVVSYLTDTQGHYLFKRLAAGTDYEFYATYRGHRSSIKRLGMFDSKSAQTTVLVISLH